MALERFKFSDEERNNLINLEPDLNVLEEEIKVAKDIGIDTDDLEKEFKRVTKLRTGMLKAYG